MKTLMKLLTVAIIATLTVTAHAATAAKYDVVQPSGANTEIIKIVPTDNPEFIAVPAIGLTTIAFGENTEHAITTAFTGTPANAFTTGIGIIQPTAEVGYGASTDNGSTAQAVGRTAVTTTTA